MYDPLAAIEGEVSTLFNGSKTAFLSDMESVVPNVITNALQDAKVKSMGYRLQASAKQVQGSSPWLQSYGSDPRVPVAAWFKNAESQTADQALRAGTDLLKTFTDAWANVSAKPGAGDYGAAAFSSVQDFASGASRAVQSAAAATPSTVKYAAYGIGALAVIVLIRELRR